MVNHIKKLNTVFRNSWGLIIIIITLLLYCCSLLSFCFWNYGNKSILFVGSIQVLSIMCYWLHDRKPRTDRHLNVGSIWPMTQTLDELDLFYYQYHKKGTSFEGKCSNATTMQKLNVKKVRRLLFKEKESYFLPCKKMYPIKKGLQ